MRVQIDVGIQAAKAAELFAKAAEEATTAIGRDGAFRFEIDLEPNGPDDPEVVRLVLSNDDMERPEMDGRVMGGFSRDD